MKPWQERLFENSLMKKEKVRLILKMIDFSDKKIFDLGCSNGVVSYQLKISGGSWIHSDLDYENLKTSKSILVKDIFQQPEDMIPLKDNQFDCVLALDFLEHIDDDIRIVKEINRILKTNGKVIISTPISGGFFFLNWFKSKLGLRPEIYGHKREGYSLSELKRILAGCGFSVTHSSTYAKFCVELLEVFLNILFVRINKIRKTRLRSGSISPSSEKDFGHNSGLFKVYSTFIYPIIYIISRIDKLLWFKTGYATFVIAEKECSIVK